MLAILPPSLNVLRNINIYEIISIIGKIFESSFLINLFGDRNVARIFYKLSQSYRHANHDDKHLGTEE
jgi:hypothetical protein